MGRLRYFFLRGRRKTWRHTMSVLDAKAGDDIPSLSLPFLHAASMQPPSVVFESDISQKRPVNFPHEERTHRSHSSWISDIDIGEWRRAQEYWVDLNGILENIGRAEAREHRT
jgi:hypothetical protein